MKIDQILDEKTDKNEIEAKYLWIFNTGELDNYIRIDLSTLIADFIPKTKENHIIQTMPIPNNYFFGNIVCNGSEFPHYYFIADENLNISLIGRGFLNGKDPYSFQSCFYNDSIFIFESGHYHTRLAKLNHRSRKYSIISHKWDIIASFPDSIWCCIGINEKIIIASKYPDVWVYDIILNSYSENFLDKCCNADIDQMLIKSDGKIYLLLFSLNKEIYYCNHPMETWTLLGKFKKSINGYNSIVCYRGSFYYSGGWVERKIYQFSLDKFQPKAIKIKDKADKKSKIWRFVNYLFS